MTRPPAGRPAVAPHLAAGAYAVAAVATVLGLLLFLDNRQFGGTNRFFDPVMPVTGLSFTAAGAFVTARRPDVPVGWILFAGLLVALAFFAEQYGVHALETRPGGLPAGKFMAWLGGWLWAPGYLALWTALPLVLPHERLPSARVRPLLGTAVALIVVVGALGATAPAAVAAGEGLGGVTGAVHAAGVFVLAPACWAVLLAWYRRAGRQEREQLAWPVRATGAAAAVPLAVVLAGVLVEAWVPLRAYQWAAAVALGSVPAAIVLAAVRHGLYRLDVKADAVVDRLLVHAVMTVLGTGVFLLVLGVLEASVAGQRLALGLVAVTVALIAVLSLRPAMERTVDRLLYRRRRYDYRVLTSLGRSLRTSLGADVVLPTVVEAVAAGLRVPYVAVSVGHDLDAPVAAAAHGEPVDRHHLVIPLVHQNEVVGRLTVAPRGPREPLDATDRRLLADVAGQVAVVAYALSLTADLQRSRERLVMAREEERSRLRRDLHDGLQPALSGVLLGLDAVRNHLGRTGTAEELLGRLRDELERAAGGVRRLVYGLRPPALDELGLVGALRQQAAVFALSPAEPDVVVTAPTELGPLPPAVEVAAYRICMEAVENVRKHASARTCEVALTSVDGALHVEVRDDGTGLPQHMAAGVGLQAMRERAAELGGTCTVQSAPGAGTSVRAVLPLGQRP